MTELEKITLERNAYRAVLVGAEYEEIDDIGKMDELSAGIIGAAVAKATKAIIADHEHVVSRARALLDFLEANCGDSDNSIVEIKCNGEDSDLYAVHVAGLLTNLENAIKED